MPSDDFLFPQDHEDSLASCTPEQLESFIDSKEAAAIHQSVAKAIRLGLQDTQGIYSHFTIPDNTLAQIRERQHKATSQCNPNQFIPTPCSASRHRRNTEHFQADFTQTPNPPAPSTMNSTPAPVSQSPVQTLISQFFHPK
eukprot:jgi/Psemu1/2868/gm1.2868_g